MVFLLVQGTLQISTKKQTRVDKSHHESFMATKKALSILTDNAFFLSAAINIRP